jgi:hypothetical protein
VNAVERTKAIQSSRFHASHGKWSQAKAAALELTWRFTQDEYREQAKETLLWLALNNPERLREFADALCRLKRAKRDKCPRGHNLVTAYAACESLPPAFGEIKQAFIAKFGKKKWDGGNEDDPSCGDYSARKTLKALRLPWTKIKTGRPSGLKSRRIMK